MTMPADPTTLRERVAREQAALFGREPQSADYDRADAAIRIVVEACAEVCDAEDLKWHETLERTVHRDNRHSCMQRASQSRDIAAMLRSLATPNAPGDEVGEGK